MEAVTVVADFHLGDSAPAPVWKPAPTPFNPHGTFSSSLTSSLM